MATKNIQMNILTDSGSYDTLYPQTTASQAGARPSTWTPTASQVGALPITGGTLTGDLRLKDNSNYGRKLYFGDGEYAFIGELSDDNLTIKAKNIELTTSDGKLTWNGNVIGGQNESLNLIYETGTRHGTGTETVGTTFTIQCSKITKIFCLLWDNYLDNGTYNYPGYVPRNENNTIIDLAIINQYSYILFLVLFHKKHA